MSSSREDYNTQWNPRGAIIVPARAVVLSYHTITNTLFTVSNCNV